MTKRDAKIIKDAEEQNIPIFVITAKDDLAPDVLDYYSDAAKDAHCSEEFIKGVEARLDEFSIWQQTNPDKVKIPD